MDLTNPFNGRIFHSGTFNGNPVTTAAGLVVAIPASAFLSFFDGKVQKLQMEVIDALEGAISAYQRGLSGEKRETIVPQVKEETSKTTEEPTATGPQIVQAEAVAC